jgi:hypothetical protein
MVQNMCSKYTVPVKRLYGETWRVIASCYLLPWSCSSLLFLSHCPIRPSLPRPPETSVRQAGDKTDENRRKGGRLRSTAVMGLMGIALQGKGVSCSPILIILKLLFVRSRAVESALELQKWTLPHSWGWLRHRCCLDTIVVAFLLRGISW